MPALTNWSMPRSPAGRRSSIEVIKGGWQQRLGQIAIICFIAFVVYAAALGLEIWFGSAIAAVLVMGSLIFRLGVTFVIGAFLCAHFVWGWTLVYATLFSAPTLILLFPHLLADLVRLKPRPA